MRIKIYSGKKFSADFVVVSSDGVTPEILAQSDTAYITISTNGVNPTVVIDSYPLTIVDADNGLFNLALDETTTSLLKQDLGAKEDRYSELSNYIGFIDFLLLSGTRQADMDVFVKEVGYVV